MASNWSSCCGFNFVILINNFTTSSAANLMAITEGMSFCWTSPMIPYFLSNETHIVMTRYEAEWLETSYLLGALGGLPLTAICIDKLGRKAALLCFCSILVVVWIVIALANHIAYLYAARLIQGMVIYAAFVASIMYVGEISHKSFRGFLSSLMYIMSVFGIVIIYIIGPALPFYVPSIIASAILVCEIVIFSFMPESPYFLLAKGQQLAAEESLLKLRKSADVDNDLREITQSIEADNKENGRFQDIFKTKNYRKSFLISLTLNIGQLFCGIDVILMNLHEILEFVESKYITASNAGIMISIINFISSIVAAALVDKFGRKKLLVVSTSLTGVCLFAIATYFQLMQLNFDVMRFSWVPIVSMMFYAAVYRVGLGMVPIVLTSEIFASKIKTIGCTFDSGMYMISSVLAVQVFFFLRDTFGFYMPFYTSLCFSVLTLISILFVVPETKGKNLEEIQQILKK